MFCLFPIVLVLEIVFSSGFLFFKQKTAYEMRISDWSSDVCSSDLPAARLAGHQQRPDRLGAGRTAGLAGQQAVDSAVAEPPDRKSVVSGKRVSVRVDLGGRRIMKNTTSRKKTTRQRINDN